MIATEAFSQVLLRAVAPFVWRSAEKVARKLEGFAATEAGSALDMLKAAELTDDARLRWLFFRHAMDEARHATMFRDAARALRPDARGRLSEYNLIHARRQNLFAQLPLTEFLAFVYLAEKRGELQFQVLSRHFGSPPVIAQPRAECARGGAGMRHAFREMTGQVAVPELAALFSRIAKEERFHVSYSRRLLDERRRAGGGAEVATALWKVRLRGAWQGWRRSGRVLGDLTGRLLLSAVYLLALPVFALIGRLFDRPTTGWKRRAPQQHTLEAARRQF